MFDDKNNINSDLLMRSILENGQEEVPARVWDKVAAGLDASARRKKVALWWRRSAVAGTVAAAAAVRAGRTETVREALRHGRFFPPEKCRGEAESRR